MVCKKCKEVLPDDATVCTCCGAKIQQKRSKRHGSARNGADSSASAEKKKMTVSSKIKIVATVLGIAIVIAAVVILIVSMFVSDGKKTAEVLSEYIGQTMLSARNDSDIKVYEESNFKAVNNAMKFNYLVEDDDSVKVDGIKFPNWLVTVSLNDEDEIVTVTYTDFTVCKKNHKGQKADKLINLDNVMKNEKYKNVEKEIDLDVYSITYENAFITYTYKYYYEDEAGNEQAVRLTVTYNVNMEYQYYSSALVYPEDI